MYDKTNREPTAEELAREMDVPLEQVEDLIDLAREPISLDKSVGEKGDTVTGDLIKDDLAPVAVEAVAHVEMIEQVHAAIGRLEEEEAKVVRMRHGIGDTDGKPATFIDIGKRVGKHDKTVSDIYRVAMAKLMDPSRALQLDQFIRSA
jgi:RNA polymerase primary sigma factor